jgi:hypothetical protein
MVCKTGHFFMPDFGSNDILVGKPKKYVKNNDFKNLISLPNNLSNWSSTTNPNLIYLISPFPDNTSESDRIPLQNSLFCGVRIDSEYKDVHVQG